MQTRTEPQTASPMEALDEAHQLEIQILNLKSLGYTMVRGAIPPDMLKEIQNAFKKKMGLPDQRHIDLPYQHAQSERPGVQGHLGFVRRVADADLGAKGSAGRLQGPGPPDQGGCGRL